jgi:hypothetical protein
MSFQLEKLDPFYWLWRLIMFQFEAKQSSEDVAAPKPPSEYLVYCDGAGIWKVRYEMRERGMHILNLEELPSYCQTPEPVTFYNRKSLRFIEGGIL